MQESAKYLIHADITANGVVERSDVVGAVFGQTEGLLGDELDIRELQNSDQLGRINVEIASESGASFGSITIASGLDKVQTAILAAALESIERVGPCRATVEVSSIEDVRSAKRRAVVERAKELLAEFDETALTNQELVEEVRQSLRVEDVADYEGLPAGPRIPASDAVIVVEGRADVLTLLRYGVNNAIAVEGTNVPDAVADLTEERTVTAFVDGDRGGTLILRELAQVGDIDYVAVAPDGKSVEDLSRGEVMDALRQKVPYGEIEDESDPVTALAATDGSARPAPPGAVSASESESTDSSPETGEESVDRAADASPESPGTNGDGPSGTAESGAGAASGTSTTGETAASEAASGAGDGARATPEEPAVGAATEGSSAESTAGVSGAETTAGSPPAADAELPEEAAEGTDRDGHGDATGGRRTLAGHVEAVIGESSGRVRLLGEGSEVLAETDAGDAFDAIEGAETVPRTVVVDGELSQRVLDVAAQRGVEVIVACERGEFVKQPTSVRIRLAEEF